MKDYVTIWQDADLELRLYPGFYLVVEHGLPSFPFIPRFQAEAEYKRRLKQREPPNPTEEEIDDTH